MSALIWLNENWHRIVLPLALALITSAGGLWIRRLLFDFLWKSKLKSKWKPSPIVFTALWRPFLHWWVLLGALFAIELSILPSAIKAVGATSIASLYVLSLAWVAATLGVGLVLFYQIEFRRSLDRVRAPQPPTTIVINAIRALVALVAVVILVSLWEGPDIAGILILAACLVVGGVAVGDVVPRMLRRHRWGGRARIFALRMVKLALSLVIIGGLVDVCRRIIFVPPNPGPQQNASVLLVLLELALVVWAVGLVRNRRYIRARPPFKAVLVSVLAAFMIPAMMGVSPFSTWANTAIGQVKESWQAIERNLPEPAPSTDESGTTTDAVESVCTSVVTIFATDGMGSGMLLDDDGLVLTCCHVVEDEDTVTVVLYDESCCEYEVIARDADLDLALLSPLWSMKPSTHVTLGSSATVRPGDDVFLIGYAEGLQGEPTVTKGIVSATRIEEHATYVQTDAPMNPGNSGGPLITMKGEVVAVAVGGLAGTDIEGMNFAVAIDCANEFIEHVARQSAAAAHLVEEPEIAEAGDVVEAIEHEVMTLVNVERAARGTGLLVWDTELHRIARDHSAAMAARGELFHSSMYMPYCENCWGGTGAGYFGAGDIVQSWMESDKHRTWLLCPNLKHIGVGIVQDGSDMYASWTFWRSETCLEDWWYANGAGTPPDWWH